MDAERMPATKLNADIHSEKKTYDSLKFAV